MPSFRGHEFRNQSDILSLWCKAGFCRMNLPSTIYPKSRFCTKRHKRLYFQGFSGVFEGFSQNAEKGNCKFEPQKCKSVFEVCFGTFHTHKPLFRRETFSLTTETRFLRGDRESGKHLLTACSYLFDNFGLRYKVHDCYRYDISYHIQDWCPNKPRHIEEHCPIARNECTNNNDQKQKPKGQWG